jgi:hypothetical protein
MTSLVFAVEADFAIEIPDRAITPANFTSVTSISDLVRTLRPGQPSLPSIDIPAPNSRSDYWVRARSTTSSRPGLGRGNWSG